MNEQEDALIERMQLACEKMESFVAASEDLKQVLAYKKSLIGDVLDAKTNATKLRVHNHVSCSASVSVLSCLNSFAFLLLFLARLALRSSTRCSETR